MSHTTTSPEEKNAIVGGTLYLVSTPIGNLADLSERAIKVLSEVDFVAAEDTRNTGKLLACLGISRPMLSYYEHNKRERGPQIIQRLLAGDSCALCSDAGTPAISDPGEDLVSLCAQRGIPVTSVPGCCAAITALTLSGLSTARFCFEGFLPVEKSKRRERLEQLTYNTATMILYEAPHKLRATLDDLASTLGVDRPAALCRELTKRNEEIFRTTLGGAIERYKTEAPRGEYVLIVAGGSQSAPTSAERTERMTLSPKEHVAYYESTGLGRMDAIKAAAKERGIPKNELYRQLNLQK
ncbi:MAG: 16S rRNA (cytidine(1402)-2'-O)-methyltransferase [Ruminococcaceae bacterium]|nr:16S rRNA (cytidine(1402)-2'-O)-methyltransferase [Oscillospiraceae bacterium]